MMKTLNRLRLDRFLTLGLVRPLMRLNPIKKRSGIPILMYHSISEEPRCGVHAYYQTSTSPSAFRSHMAFLKSSGYSVLPLKEAVLLIRTDHDFNGKAAVLTFDDGYEDFFTEAFPILHEYGYPSTVFLPTAFIDDHNSKFIGKSCLSWDKVGQLHRHGVTFGAHTVNHPELVALNSDEIQAELALSKKTIASKLGEDVESFSYPFAFPEEDVKFVRTLKNQLQAAGYLYGVTTKVGISNSNEDPLFLKRIPMNEGDDIEFFEAKLNGAYDWLHPLQRLFKYLKRKMKKRKYEPSEIRTAVPAPVVHHSKATSSSATGRPGQGVAA